jgi:hypothetical protein
MTTKIVQPVLQRAPVEYSQSFMDQMMRTLRITFDRLTAGGHVQATTLNLSDIQGHGGGLRVGDVFHLSGALYIVLENQGYAGGLPTMETSLGSVTVTV